MLPRQENQAAIDLGSWVARASDVLAISSSHGDVGDSAALVDSSVTADRRTTVGLGSRDVVVGRHKGLAVNMAAQRMDPFLQPRAKAAAHSYMAGLAVAEA